MGIFPSTSPSTPPSPTPQIPFIDSLTSLQSNLQEIYAAVHAPQPSLVANVQGTRIYTSSQGIGRLWTFFYKIIGVFRPKAIHAAKDRKLMQALHRTNLIFQQRLQAIQSHLKEYREYLHSACHGYIFTGDVNRVNQSRWEITNWNDATLPFLKLLYRKKNSKLIQLLQKYFPQNPDQPTQAIFSSERLLECSQQQSVIDLESVLQSSMPFDALGRIWRRQHQDDTQLRRCLRVIKQRQNNLPTNIFHDGVKSMIELDMKLDIIRNAKEIQQKLALLEVMLIDEGCNNLFVKKDEEHLAWRDSLKEGDSITCNGNTIILGKQVGIPRLHDKTVLFELQGNPDSLVMIKINRAILGIKKELQSRLSQLSNGTYKIIPYLEIDIEGICALVPKLHESLNNIVWMTPPNEEKICKADYAKFSSLCEFLKNMRKNQITPKFFSSNILMFDKQDQLWFFKPPQEGPFDFNAIQDFVLKVSNNNLTIFRHLMHASGMDSHPIAQLYRLVFDEALKDSNHENIANIIQRVEIDKSFGAEPKILKAPIEIRAQQLYYETLAMKQKWVEELQKTRNMTPAEASKIASRNLSKAYEKTNAAGILWPTLSNMC